MAIAPSRGAEKSLLPYTSRAAPAERLARSATVKSPAGLAPTNTKYVFYILLRCAPCEGFAQRNIALAWTG